MPHPTKSQSRAALQDGFEALILQEIESGRLKPGDRLPSTAELAARHRLNLRTVQAVLSTLAARGIVERKPRRGTIVLEASNVPRVLFLTGWSLEQEPSYMLRSLVHHLRDVFAGKGFQLVVKHDLHSLFTGDEAHFRRGCTRLKAELEAEAPAGFIEYQFSLKRLSAIYPDFALPTVNVASSGQSGDIEYDKDHFIAESLNHLQEAGCKRILMLRKGGLSDSLNALDVAFWLHLKRFRFKRGEIREIINRYPAVAVERAAEASLLDLIGHWSDAPKNEIPDGLLVQDDIMMRGIATALLKAAPKAPRPLEIVHIANEGIHHHYGIPTTRYELPIRAMACEIAALFEQRLCRKPGRVPGPIVLRGEIAPSRIGPLPAPTLSPHESLPSAI